MQADVCRCPSCTSSFVSSGSHRPELMPQRLLFPRGPFMPGRRLMSDKVCLVHCGDACDCGQGPESADLDPVDVAGMRAVEGRG